MKSIRMKDMIAEIAYVTGQTQTRTQETLRLLLVNIVSELAKGNRVEFRDFGVFDILFVKARKGYNPNKKKVIMLPARNRIRFRAGRRFRREIKIKASPLKEALEE